MIKKKIGEGLIPCRPLALGAEYFFEKNINNDKK
jgi:hypothetical protein